MITIPLSQLLAPLYDTTLYSHINITGLTLDSRKVKPGDLFFACKGTHLDGREFISQAIENGAHAILAEADSPTQMMSSQNNVPIFPIVKLNQYISEIAARFYNEPAKKMKMIGITGTNGKTSCSHFMATALQSLQVPCGVIGTLGNGLYGAIKEGTLTTPDPVTLQKILADLHQEGAKAIAMEVSSHSIDQSRVQSIAFDVAIFTNLTRDHLDYHGTMEAYGATKEKLFSDARTHHAVINADDPFGRKMLARLNKKNRVAYSVESHCELALPLVKVINHHRDEKGIQFTVSTPWGIGESHIGLIGSFNLSNALAVLTTLCLLDVPLGEALEALSHLRSVPGRMQRLGGDSKPVVVVDYAHTPDALEKVLMALRAHCTGRLYCLFGCGGDRDKGKRPLMAKIAEQYADQVIVTDDNPRHEKSADIIADIMLGFRDPANVIVQADRARAIQHIIAFAQVGDCVLIAGKGAESYQQVGDIKLPFSDIEQVLANLTI